MQDSLSQTFSALADPTRRAIIAQLSHGDSNVTDLARPFLNDMSLPAITKHLKVLEKAGLITKTRDAQWRQCKLNKEGFKDMAGWMEEYRIFWEESFDRLDAHLAEIMSKAPSSAIAPSVEAAEANAASETQADSKTHTESQIIASVQTNASAQPIRSEQIDEVAQQVAATSDHKSTTKRKSAATKATAVKKISSTKNKKRKD